MIDIKKIKNISFFILLPLFLLLGCQSSDTADLIIKNGNIYTVDKENPTAQALAIKGDRILAIGSNEAMETFKTNETKMIDAQEQFVMPGFIEGHAHFTNMGNNILNLNFLQSKNWNEIVQQVAEKAKTVEPGEWIIGRGWHQEKWNEALDRQVHGYPYHDLLSEVSPDNPVMLAHASGHSLFANAKAMELAGISVESPNPSGGEIIRSSSGEAIGVFEERAMNSIRAAYNNYLETIPEAKKKERWLKGIHLAQAECLSKGITSFQDAGSTFQQIEDYKELAETGELDIRLWAMIRHSYKDMADKVGQFPIINAGNHHFTVRAIKSEVDGALGSFGAWLLKSYNDKPNFEGQNTTPISEVKNIAQLAFKHDLQFCVHAIGDRANRIVLNIYEETFQSDTSKNNLRWRVEHAQHLDPKDIPRFKDLEVIASMQGIHCTSDAPFVVQRLGEERARVGAYPWRSLLDAGVVIANGTDAPVEDVDPIESFYASVTRKRVDSGLEFFPQQSMTREEAIYSYTLGNAYAAFEETDKGSLEVGKLADIVVLSKDLQKCADNEIMDTKVIYTIVGGEVKYEK